VHYNSATIGYCKGRLVAQYHALAHPTFSLWWAAGRRNEAEGEVGRGRGGKGGGGDKDRRVRYFTIAIHAPSAEALCVLWSSGGSNGQSAWSQAWSATAVFGIPPTSRGSGSGWSDG
jgi:hypothetical protein